MKESVLSFEGKTTQSWFTYFQIAGKYNVLFILRQTSSILFSIWLL